MIFQIQLVIIYLNVHLVTDLDKPPTDVELGIIVDEIPNWDDVAIGVGVPIENVKEFRKRDAGVNALQLWKNGKVDQRDRHPNTWRHLLEVVRNRKGPLVAEKLKARVEKEIGQNIGRCY